VFVPSHRMQPWGAQNAVSRRVAAYDSIIPAGFRTLNRLLAGASRQGGHGPSFHARSAFRWQGPARCSTIGEFQWRDLVRDPSAGRSLAAIASSTGRAKLEVSPDFGADPEEGTSHGGWWKRRFDAWVPRSISISEKARHGARLRRATRGADATNQVALRPSTTNDGGRCCTGGRLPGQRSSSGRLASGIETQACRFPVRDAGSWAASRTSRNRPHSVWGVSAPWFAFGIVAGLPEVVVAGVGGACPQKTS